MKATIVLKLSGTAEIARLRTIANALSEDAPPTKESVHPEWSKELPTQELTELRAGAALDKTTIDILRRGGEEDRAEMRRLEDQHAAEGRLIEGQQEKIRSLESEVHRLNEWKKSLLETAGSISESSSAGGPSSEGAPPLAPKVQGQPAEVSQPPAIAALGKRRGPAEYDVYLDPGQPGGVAIEPSNEQKETTGQAAEAGAGHPDPTVADVEKNAAEQELKSEEPASAKVTAEIGAPVLDQTWPASPPVLRWGKVADPGAAFHIWPLEDAAEAECGEITDAEVTFIEGRPPAEEACCDCADLSGWKEPTELSRLPPAPPPPPQQDLHLQLNPACYVPGCLLPGELDPVTKGWFCGRYHLANEVTIRWDFFFAKHPDKRPKPEKKLALKKSGGRRKKDAPAEEGKPDA